MEKNTRSGPVSFVPQFVAPTGSTDCHMHVFEADYPLSPNRTYTPAPAALGQYRKVISSMGLTRAVVVQPSAYGTDNSCTLNAVQAFGASARAVIGLDLDLADDELDQMDRRGARGVRVNLASCGLRDVDTIADLITATAKRIERLGWHLQIFTDLGVIERLRECLRRLTVPVVIDHMGLALAAHGPRQHGFSALGELIANGRGWVKLSGAYRISAQESRFIDADTIIRALIAANPDRCIWGTDWPHTGGHSHFSSASAPVVAYRPIDTSALLQQLFTCAGDVTVVSKILVDNPARLYGF